MHLEVVSDLTPAAFTTSLHCFISRRGLPTEIHSDNGTNFVGAANDLKDLYFFFSNDLMQKTLSTALSNRCITWHFNPVRAYHFGGLWEAVVKSAKFHLRRVIGLQRFTFEELSTIPCQVEACLNSCPLLPANTPSDNGIDILTPGHFLIGHPLKSVPTHDLTYEKIPLLNDGISAKLSLSTGGSIGLRSIFNNSRD